MLPDTCISAYCTPDSDVLSDRLDHGGKNDETSTDVDASFSCADCGQEFNSRQELKEHESTQH